MKQLTILTIATILTLAALPAEARWHLPWNHGADPLQSLIGQSGVPILDPADLQAAHAILSPAVANGAGFKIKAADNCVVAWLAHPEYLSATAPAPVATSQPAVTTGPISQGAALAVELDAAARGLQKKIALFNAPLPDDVVLACAPLSVTPGGIVNALHGFLHPGTVATGTP